ELAEQVTSEALGAVPAAFNCGADAVLLTALVAAAARWRGESSDSARASAGLLVNLEGHGREALAGAPDVDVSGAVGWFTTQHPVRLDPGRAAAEQFWDPSRPEPGDALKLVKEQLRAVPDAGLGWGLLRYLNPDTAPTLAALAVPDLSFNYLGRFSGDDAAGGELLGTAEDGAPLRHAVEIDAIAVDRDGALRLAAAWSYAQDVLTETEVRRLADLWQEAIGVLAAHAGEEGAGGHTASDFALVDLSQDQLAMLERGL
ncbi:MAG: condensation domain-containing protein, partial [Micromonosporaceae bacterium]